MRREGLFLLVALVSNPRGAWPQGNPVGPEFPVNTYTTGHTQDGSNWGVFGQRYGQIVPVELMRFTVE
jgi:hypothetical protein